MCQVCKLAVKRIPLGTHCHNLSSEQTTHDHQHTEETDDRQNVLTPNLTKLQTDAQQLSHRSVPCACSDPTLSPLCVLNRQPWRCPPMTCRHRSQSPTTALSF